MFPPSTHAPMSPSRLQRIIDCPGSYSLVRDIEDKEGSEGSIYAAEGSHLHSAVETHLLKYAESAFTTPLARDIVNPSLDAEQQSACQECIDYLYQVIRPLQGPSLQIKVEERVYLKEFHQVLYDCHGTCDVVITTDDELHVIDWKFGKGIPVYVKDNDQLLAYLAGAVRNFESLFAEHPGGRETAFHMHVVQPRLDNFDHLELSAEELDKWLSGRLIPGVSKAYEKHAPFIPGQKQCRWCAAKNQCRARYNMANQTAADIFKAVSGLPDEVTLEEIAEVLKNAKLVEDHIKDLRLFVQRKLEAGISVPGFKMVRGRSIRRWKDQKTAIKQITALYDYSDCFISKFISPAQAEKLDKTLKKEEWFTGLIEKPEGKPTLVSESDKRAPINYETAEQKFAHLKTEE